MYVSKAASKNIIATSVGQHHEKYLKTDMNIFLSLSIILEYENQEELHVVCLFLHDSHFQIKHLKALPSLQFPLSKYYTIPMQFLKIQRQDL